ncbi:maestro heat-like repeat-containing protein family member 7 isoform X2 [Opisthocomus hoazin]|uniref:maestro heat-like repeat-containing protein family member 7 isoform X2 n=1 Tax=Opisthocomus hoazin TaxID=30419 RepID=UPI003F5311C4
MAERSPSRPGVAWEEDGAPQESSSLLEPGEVYIIQPLQIVDASWLPVYQRERELVEFIVAFVSSPEEDAEQKMRFLDNIRLLLRTVQLTGLSEGLDIFCRRFRLVENIEMLLDEEPRDQLSTPVQHFAMDAIVALSSVRSVLEGKERRLLAACFRSVFWLPPKGEIEARHFSLYMMTLMAMDKMLESVVLSYPASRVSEGLQSIFQMLLDLATSDNMAVQERALQRIMYLSRFLADKPTVEAWDRVGRDTYGSVCYRDIQIPILGRLLGCLILFQSSSEATAPLASDAFRFLQQFMENQ